MSGALLVDVVLTLAALAVLLPAAVFALEIAAAVFAGREAAAAPLSLPARTPSLRLAVLMPAHDEAEGIARSLRALKPQIGSGDRVLVVADNCSDATAAVARSEGAEVCERSDPVRRGKGYALDFGVRHLEADPPDIVVIVDADCIVAPGALAELASECSAHGRPVQALYLMRAPRDAGVGLRIAEFAWVVKNEVRPLGGAALGWPCQLMGTGMAFPWPLLAKAPLASGHLVEDMQLGLDLARAGAAPLFCPRALVTSEFPIAREGVVSQRTRWEHGHLSVIASVAPRLLPRALLTGNGRLLALVLDLMVPPLAALVLVIVVLLAAGLLSWQLGASPVALLLAAAALALVAAGAIGAWASFGRHVVRGRELLALPLYVLAKMPVYARLFTRRQSEWIRTRRDGRHR
jgi:cellulose synthase/poly-beta-1,6-N-acetylglucosamine synthase-like glycosyltransferase